MILEGLELYDKTAGFDSGGFLFVVWQAQR